MAVRFLPTVYEHAAALLGETPSALARDACLLARGQLEAQRRYGHSLISVGLDIYNIEAEAMGGTVDFYDGPQLPSLRAPLFAAAHDFARRRVPDPETDGRMPLMLRACELLVAGAPEGVVISGSITGPFTLAAILRGFEAFIGDLIDEPDFAAEQMRFAAEVGVQYARAVMRRGAVVALNDSWIAPPLLSPSLYREHVFVHHQEMIGALKRLGLRHVALICGGDVSAIAQELSQTGTSLMMADWPCDRVRMAALCAARGITLRACVEPALLEHGDVLAMQSAARRVADECRAGAPNAQQTMVMGCGIVSYNTPPEHVLRFKEIVEAL